jgi:hypothetical protein
VQQHHGHLTTTDKMTSSFALCLLLGACLALSCSAGAWDFTIPAGRTASAAPAGACDAACDPQAVGVLLQQLAAARRQSLELRDQLLRAKHHSPIVIGSPLDTALVSAAAWALCAVLAVACGAIFAHSRSSRAKAAAHIKRLQQALMINDALWRRDFGKEQAKAQELAVQLQEHKQRGAAWRHSVEQTAHDLTQRAAALQARSPSTPGHALLVSKCTALNCLRTRGVCTCMYRLS